MKTDLSWKILQSFEDYYTSFDVYDFKWIHNQNQNTRFAVLLIVFIVLFVEEKKVTLIFIMYHLCVYEVSYKILRLLRLTADLSNEPKI